MSKQVQIKTKQNKNSAGEILVDCKQMSENDKKFLKIQAIFNEDKKKKQQQEEQPQKIILPKPLKKMQFPIVPEIVQDRGIKPELLVRDSEEDILDDDGILIGPQDSSEVNLSENWGAGISTVDDALDALKSGTDEISANIEDALKEISSSTFNVLSDTAKIAQLRAKVNGMAEILRELYRKF